MISLIRRIITQILNDKRTLVLVLLAPLLILTLIYFLLNDSKYVPKVAQINMPQNILTMVSKQMDIVNIDANTNIDEYLKTKKTDAVIYIKDNKFNIRALESNIKTTKVMKNIQESLASLNSSKYKFDFNYIYGNDSSNLFLSLGYVFVGIMAFFFVFVISGMALVKERTMQTMERMLMRPISRFKIVMGYMLGYGIISIIQSVIIILYTHYVLGLDSVGSIYLCILIMILLALTAVSLGSLISTFASSEFQVAQFIPIIIIPQIFFSGLISIDTIPYGLGNISYIMPVYYGCSALKKIMIEGATFLQIIPMITAMITFIIILFFVNVIALKKYRQV